jgi:predicted DNA-binding protein with PD1-like motif
MAFFTGRTGSLAVDGTQVAKIRDWSIETTVELLSTNTIESTSNTFVPGVKGATGSATLMYYRTEASDVGKTQFTTLLNKIQKTGAIETTDRVEIELNVGTDDKDDIKFNAYITSATVSTSTGELAVVPINFTVDGDFTEYVEA